MKLRTRLFLWVGTLFFLAFGVSLLFEIYTTDRNLKEAAVDLREQLMAQGEKRRENIEKFLHVSLIEEQALIDALLLRLSRDTQLGNTLFLDPKEVEIEAPIHSAYLFRNKNWIDFIQTTKNGQLTSLLIPIEFPMTPTHYIPIDEDFGWVVIDSDRQIDRPMIGVRYNALLDDKDISVPLDQLLEMDWGLTILFNPETLKNFKRPDSLEGKDLKADQRGFFNSVERAAAFLKSGREHKNWMREDILRREKGKGFFSNLPFDLASRCLGEEGEALNQRVIQLLQQGDQGIMVSVLASLFPSGVFGHDFFTKEAPKGIARFPKDERAGNAVFTDEVFHETPLFEDRDYILQYPSKPACKGIGSSIAVISSPKSDQVFVGNTLELEEEDKRGYLTVGVNVRELVQNLTFSTDQSAFLVHNGRVISAYDDEGLVISNPSKSIPFKSSMLQEKSGLFNWKGQSYYFLHMVPFHDVDLHFYTVQPEKAAFALVRSVEEGSRDVIGTVSLNMRLTALVALIIVLFTLHRISKRITGPISKLASVTHDVAEGKLEGIELPEPPKGKSDEVSTLISSFDQMIIGLQEKEKVKGVLNKVVSPAIAQEITKGAIHLGGEERKVTVLFGDIRNFTRMSASKDPAQVVEMLNTCMTKVSHEVDAFGGVIDKYVGDEVMALFGAPIEKEDSALNAALSALKMVEVLKEWNSQRAQDGYPPVEMGFGIHTGNVLVGNMGAENRLNYTVIGGNVNFANRLCSAAQPMEILISKETLSEPHVQESLIVEECPPIKVKGYDEAFIVYRVKGTK